MSSYLTTDTLIESVKRRAHIPESQVTFQDEDFLAFANEEMMIGLVPAIMKMHEEFYVFPVNVSLVASQSNYGIPDRAVGSKLRAAFFRDSSSNVQELARIDPSDLAFYQQNSSSFYPKAFYLENNDLILVPDVSPSPTGVLILKIFLRPNQLVAASRIATIESIDTSTGDIIVDSVPSVFTTAATYDFIEVNRGHKCKAIDTAVVTINSTLRTITFAPADLPSSLNVGDQIALAGETMIPQMPDDLHSILAQRVACRCLEAQKDLEGLQAANAKLQEMETNLGMLIDNRTEGQPKKVNNLRGVLRFGKFRRGRRGY